MNFFEAVFYSSVLFSTAGLPQYGQLGHGTDNEVVCYSINTDNLFIYFISMH